MYENEVTLENNNIGVLVISPGVKQWIIETK